MKVDPATFERRHIDAIVGHRFERIVRRRLRMPVQLHVQAAGPLDYCVLADRIVERLDDRVRRIGKIPAAIVAPDADVAEDTRVVASNGATEPASDDARAIAAERR